MKADEILIGVLDKKTPEERQAYLDAACGADAQLRSHIEGLLKSLEEAGSFLEQPLFESPPTRDEPGSSEQAGQVVGPYKLIQQIGEGGMGTVFMAQQTEPVKRLVALKIIKAGMDSKQVIARFEAERQALALMDHPNIAKVLDAGTTTGGDRVSAGRPYFVMELVKGVPITRYCDEHHLTPRQRLELFIPMCQAIQHAHQKGIIHRDLKPSNVLIAMYDGRPVPKVIDFGVAKATGQQLTERTLVTGFGAIVGTLEYMSPEQAELNQLDIDTRSDIYSLGVLLYELLTGTTPLDRKRLKDAAFTEMLRMIREEEPQKPSTRLSESKDSLPSISAQRHTEPAKLTKLMRGELDWIVMKALEKDRNRRYETANGLAMDVQRYLNDEHVLACPPSAWYRLRKFARRNKVAFTTAAVVLAALVLGIIGTTWQAIRATDAEYQAVVEQEAAEAERDVAKHARKDAEQARDQERQLREQEKKLRQEAERQKLRAEENFAKARQAVDDYFTAVSESQLLKVSGMQELRRQLLLSALAFYEQFLKERGDDPAIRAGVASAQLRVGKILQELGQGIRARQALQAARAGFEQALAGSPNDLELKAGLAEVWYRLAGLISAPAQALKPHENAIELREELLRAQPVNPRYKKDLAESLNAYGIRLVKLKRHDQALKAYRQCVTLRLELARDFPDDPTIHRSLSQSLNNIAVELANRGHRQQALEMYLQANDYSLAAFAKMPHSTDVGIALAIGYGNAGRGYWGLGQKEEGLRQFQKAVDHLKVLSQNNAAVPSVQSHFAKALQELASRQRDLERSDDAARSLRLARGIVERFPRESPDDLYNLACFRAVYAGLIGEGKAALSDDEETERREQADQAMAALQQAVAKGYADVERMKKDDDLSALRKRKDFKTMVARLQDEAKLQALAKGIKGTPEQKLSASEEAAAILKRLADRDPKNLRYRSSLATSRHAIGLLELELGKLDEAARSLAEAHAIRVELVGDDPKKSEFRADLAASHIALGNLKWKIGHQATAERWWEKGLALYNAALRDEPKAGTLLTQAAQAERKIGTTYAEVGLYEETARLFAAAFGRQAQAEAPLWRAHASLRLLVGDQEGYRAACEQMVERFGKSKVQHDLHCVATVCTLGSRGFGDAARWIELAEGFAKVDPKKTWATIYVGLAHHRAGRFDEAVKHIQPRSDWTMSWPILAMSYHRLGKAEEARRWLRKADEWYEQAIRAALSGDVQLSLGGLFIWDRPQFLVLHREAKTLIDGVAPADPWRHLWQGRIYTKLGQRDRADRHFQEAVAARPNAADILLARARVYAGLGEPARAEADFVRAIAVKESDPSPWIARGRYHAERGEHAKADADFARAASLTPDELNRFLEGGWWIAGPYPYELKMPCAPEKDADPSLPVPAFATLPVVPVFSPAAGLSMLSGLAGAQFEWKPCPTEVYGTVRRGHPTLEKPGGPASVYGLNYVYSPDERPATLLVGGDLTRVWLNGQFVHEMKTIINASFARHSPKNHLDQVLVTLKPGRNTLLVKSSDKDGGFWFRVRLADNPMDRAMALAEVGLWKESAMALSRWLEREPSFEQWDAFWYISALVNMLAGDSERYSRHCNKGRSRFAADLTKADFRPFLLAPEGAPDTAWLVELAKKLHEAEPKSGWHAVDLGIAYYRAGRYDLALKHIERAREIGDWFLYWPALAMTYHRLGQADKAREWLQRIDQIHQREMQEALARMPFQISSQAYWEDGAFFEVFRREAKQLIEGKASADNAALWAALRARAWTELREHAKAQAEFDQAVKAKPDDVRVWIARGRYFAERGDHKKANADFAKAASLTPNELNKFLEAGWWVAGPYSGNLKTPCAPENDPDPSKPVAAKSAPAEQRTNAWQSAPAIAEIGLVHLAPLFNNAKDISAYALTYVYAPEERSVLLRVGGSRDIRLWVNGRLVYESSPAPAWEWALDPVPVTLRAGRNTLLAKVSNGTGALHRLIIRLTDNPYDRAWKYADLGLLKEASDVFARQFQRTLSDNYHLWRFHASLLLANGDTAGYRRVAADMLGRWGNATDDGTCANLAITCCWGPAGTVDPARLLELARKGQHEAEPYRKIWLGIAHYRAGQFDEAIRILRELEDNRAWPVLAMAHHQLKKTDEARQWLKKAEDSYDFCVREALAGTTLKPVMGSGLHFADFLIYYREAKTLIDGPATKDPHLETLRARGLEELKKRAPATAAYDHALVLQPDQARLWLARGRRHAELKQWEKANADFTKAAELKPPDSQVCKERSHVARMLGKADEATAFLARAEELAGAFVVLGGKGAPEREFDSFADAVDSASHGDTIEVRKNGPFATTPTVVKGRAVSIRAKAGLHPVIKIEGQAAESFAPLLKTDAPLVLEGLELQRLDQKNHTPQDPQAPSIVFAAGKSLRVANCRFRTNLPDPSRPHRQVCIVAPATICDVRNCEFLSPTEVSVDTGSKKVTVDNCIHLGRLAVTMGNSAEYTLRRNTLVAPSGHALHYFLPAEALKRNQPLTPTKIAASGNVISAAAVVYVDAQHGQPKPLEFQDAAAIFPRALTWIGRENLYHGVQHSLSWTGAWEITPSQGPRDLDGWRKFWGSAESGSVFGTPRFKGGDLHARLLGAPEKITPDDFRLAEGSPGHRAGPGGKDLGADVDLVGPGPAYERWRNTPEYRRWLKDIGQSR